ncbi:MAG: hypothetical protein ACRC8A_13365 [Microcoleaceae cyanobacterium]
MAQVTGELLEVMLLLCGILIGSLLTLFSKWVMKKITLLILSEVQGFTGDANCQGFPQ